MPAVAQAWKCRKCGSSERRPGDQRHPKGKGCAECHRRAARKQTPSHPGLTVTESALFNRLLRDPFDDITVTDPMRAYLEAFTAYLMAGKTGDLRVRRRARAWRRRLLVALEGPVTNSPPDPGAK